LLIISLYGVWTYLAYDAAHNPNQLEFDVPIPKLPPQCDGYRLAMASDLHIGSMIAANEAQWAVDRINQLDPDAVALVGDIGDQPVNDVVRHKLKPLAGLKARDLGIMKTSKIFTDFAKCFGRNLRLWILSLYLKTSMQS
jgi:predicted MPP superfamily phosphohydrolase